MNIARGVGWFPFGDFEFCYPIPSILRDRCGQGSPNLPYISLTTDFINKLGIGEPEFGPIIAKTASDKANHTARGREFHIQFNEVRAVLWRRLARRDN